LSQDARYIDALQRETRKLSVINENIVSPWFDTAWRKLNIKARDRQTVAVFCFQILSAILGGCWAINSARSRPMLNF
jgi:hypothetical protein